LSPSCKFYKHVDKRGLLLNGRESWRHQLPSTNVLTSKNVYNVRDSGGEEAVFINVRVHVTLFFIYEFWATRF